MLVVSDRYPPDAAGGAEISLHLLLREPALRGEALVVTFDKALAAPALREIDGVSVLALPAPAAWPLHRLSQARVDAMKLRPYGLKWPGFVAEAAAHAARAPAARLPAFALRLAGAPAGGVRMDHAVVSESAAPAMLRAVIAAVGPALVHADNARAIMLTAEALRDGATPFLALVRDHRFTSARFDQTDRPQDGEGWRARVAAACARDALAFRQDSLSRAARVVATSRLLAASLKRVVDPQRLAQRALIPVEAPRCVAPPSDKPGLRVLIVGALNANKGQLRLLEALDQIVARVPGVSLALAGAGPDEAAIAQIAAANAATVHLHGRLAPDALSALYAACDVVAVPTLWAEPFGRVPLEAGAHGRPVVAYASGGLAETVADGETGRLVPVGDRAAFIDALARLAADPASRARMGAEGRRRVLETHAPGPLAAALKSIWDGVTPPAG